MQRLLLLLVCQVTVAQRTSDPEKLLNSCIDGKNHKVEPGKEDELHSQCSPWANHACCTKNTTYNIHGGQMYNLNFDHCRPLSEQCKKHFIQDLCFYECEPHLGPWMKKVAMKYRKERAFQVPLCAADCDNWFDDCKNDMTCAENWIKDLVTKNNKKECADKGNCKTFKEMYTNSSNFCEKVWDHAWQYTANTKACMRIWFDPSQGNPNRQVAELRIEELKATWGAAAGTLSQTLVAMILTMVVTIFVCH